MCKTKCKKQFRNPPPLDTKNRVHFLVNKAVINWFDLYTTKYIQTTNKEIWKPQYEKGQTNPWSTKNSPENKSNSYLFMKNFNTVTRNKQRYEIAIPQEKMLL
jgi:hypothetical protein